MGGTEAGEGRGELIIADCCNRVYYMLMVRRLPQQGGRERGTVIMLSNVSSCYCRYERQLEYERQAALRIEEERKQKKKLLVCSVCVHECVFMCVCFVCLCACV